MTDFPCAAAMRAAAIILNQHESPRYNKVDVIEVARVIERELHLGEVIGALQDGIQLFESSKSRLGTDVADWWIDRASAAIKAVL